MKKKNILLIFITIAAYIGAIHDDKMINLASVLGLTLVYTIFFVYKLSRSKTKK